MPNILADTNAISDGAARLDGVISALDVSYGGVNPSALGFPSAEAALTNFVVAWTAAGSILGKAVTSVQKGMTQSSSNYSHAESTNAGGWGVR